MTEPTRYSPAAMNYGKAVIELADEQKTSPEAIAGELRDLRKLVESDEMFRMYLADPAIGHVQRWNVLKKVFGGRVTPIALHLLGVLNEKDRLGLLAEVSGAFDELLDQRLGRVEVDLIVAQKLTPDQLEDARKRIATALKREPVIHVYVDDKIIGGLVLRIQDQLIDASVRHQLEAMKDRLLAAGPK